ncbi:SusC/RagA family TonB-linked outer membrane protein [Plebeiibacterium sediminum]|uniref:SusC/RagA family TonB-linked outer membrane protein n=1 Tax=Plebeiibacterium sediminum TaxID=2992112 RepID=A0AAE3M2W4_9BACT|nr:SusC/RagA family TonB-linked outer membrane protein [Plebeiobacterium sediminum]MCW3785832.1 SusC/RagA family TonB-linked outer membrane protein [Plebeiobacterium sediminum]
MKKLFINTCSALLVMLSIAVAEVQAQEKPDSIQTLNDQDSIVNVAFGTMAKRDLLGGVSSVNVSNLLEKNYQTNTLDVISSFVGGYTGSIWGQNPLVLIDGIPRSAADIDVTEIETVTVLKGASAVVLYGSKAAKGAVLITTKRGEVKPLSIEVRANGGMYVPKSYPKYLDAVGYMTLYNEAQDNDGEAHRYSDETIYNTAEGANPYKYPDLDYYSSDYLRKVFYKTDATVEISGGDDRTQYYTNFGVSYNNDLMNYGEQSKNNDLNLRVRGNLDMELTNWLTASTSAAVRFNNEYTGRGDFWKESSEMRPNWYTRLIPVSMLDPNNEELQSIVYNSNNLIDGDYLLGGNNAVQTNAFADMLAAGYIRYKTRVFQFKVSATADLSGITEGLSFSNAFAIDYNNYYSEAYKLPYATYNPVWSNMNGQDMIIGLNKYGDDGNATNEYVGDSKYKQTITFYSQLNYERSFNKVNNFSGNLIAWGFQYGQSVDEGHDGSDYHRVSNANLGLQLAYNYAHKYYVDFSGAILHSAQLPEGNRRAFSPTVSLGWTLSEENFLQDVSFLDHLKLNASYGKLNQDIDIAEYYMYQGYYNDDTWVNWQDGAGGGKATRSRRGTNMDLDFITRKELRVGFEAAMFDNKVALEMNYFDQETDGLLSRGENTVYPTYYERTTWNSQGQEVIDFSYLPYINFNQDKRTGIDFSASYSNKVGELEYKLGFVGMIYNSEATVRDEVYEDDYQYRAGKPLDASWGYVCEGFYTSEEDIASHANTYSLGSVAPGDLKYSDLNNDGIIDSRDQKKLGKSGSGASPFTYGLNLTLKYKNWTLFALGQGQSGAIGFKNSSYYWVYGNRKYSEEVLGRWTPQTAATATYPRLSATSNTNNYRNSTFWKYDNNRFDLRSVQVTYDFPKSMFNENSLLSQLSLYVNGQNLLTLSKERKMMEMNVGGAPYCRFYNLGVKATF